MPPAIALGLLIQNVDALRRVYHSNGPTGARCSAHTLRCAAMQVLNVRGLGTSRRRPWAYWQEGVDACWIAPTLT